jgi:hypothetical protein
MYFINGLCRLSGMMQRTKERRGVLSDGPPGPPFDDQGRCPWTPL